MGANAQRGHRVGIASLVGAFAVTALALLVPQSSTAADVLEILSAEHSPEGRITVLLSSSVPPETITNVRASLDGVSYPVDVELLERPPVSVVIAIDTSASMAGEPLLAAQQAAVNLIERLAPEDRVAVVQFSDETQVMSGFDGGHEAAFAAARGLWLGGSTSLYGGIERAIDLLGTEVDRTRAIVLLSDGEDTTLTDPAAVAAREGEVLRQISEAGLQLHAFAFGSGADADFLQSAAASGGGGFWSVTDGAALEELFALLGSRLGSGSEVTLLVPPLAIGSHDLVLTADVDGASVETRSRVEVTNEGVLTAVPRAASSDGGPLVVDLGSVVPAVLLTFEARVGEQPLEVIPSPPRVLLDPWEFAPGELALTVVAMNSSGVTVSETEIGLDVPRLDAELSFAVEGEGDAALGVLIGRMQGAPEAELLASSEGREIARGVGPELRFPLPPQDQPLQFALVHEGQTVRTLERHATAVASAGLSVPSVALALGGLLLLAGVTAVMFRKRQRAHRPSRRRWAPSGHTALVGRRTPSTAEASELLGRVVVHLPEGGERSYDLHRRPLTVGSSSTCDVEIRDEGVAALHARLYAMGGGDVRVHALRRHGVPDASHRDDQWVVVHDGEQLAVGRHVLTVHAAGAGAGELS